MNVSSNLINTLKHKEIYTKLDKRFALQIRYKIMALYLCFAKLRKLLLGEVQ